MWRAPLAGLASLAMVATMGVAASTANAADLGDDLKVTVNGTSYTAKYGQTLKQIGVPATDLQLNSTNWAGWYDVANGQEPVDFDASLTGNLNIKPRYDQGAKQVTFDNYGTVTPAFVDDADNTIGVDGNKVPATRVPSYRGFVVTSWKVQPAGGEAYNVTPAEASSTGIPLRDTTATSYTVTPDTAVAGKVVSFKLGAITDGNVTGVADSDSTPDGTQFNARVAVGGASVKAPQVVYGASPVTTEYLQWRDAAGNIIKIGDTIDAAKVSDGDVYTLDTSTIATATRYSVVFDLNGGKSDITNPQYVNKGSAVAKPADPTRDGYVFQGWKAIQVGTSTAKEDLDKVNTADGFYAFDSELKSDIVLQAQWAKVADIKVTFSAGNYSGAGDDATITVAGDAFVDESKAPKFTREGYTYDSWFLDADLDGQKDANETVFDFDTKLAGDANKGTDFTLVPVWTRVDENMAKQALKYVATGIKGSATVLDDSSAQVEVSDKDYFTDASWTEFEKVYKAEYQKYLSAKYKNGSTTTNEVDSKTSAEIVNALKDAWKGLRFSAKTADTVLDGKQTAGATAQVIYRLNRLGGLHHLLSGDENEVKNLTNKYIGQGGWTKDETTFRTVNNIAYDKEGTITGLEKAKWVKDNKANTDLGFSPLLKQVTRLYNAQLQEHMYTSDQNEIDTLTAGDWTEDSNLASFYVPALYNGSTKVTRLYNPSTHLHLYTADSHEVSVLTTKGGWTKDSDNASFYAL